MARRVPILWAGLALLFGACATSNVRFPSAPPYGDVTLPGTLLRPDGTGPLPAMVLLHHCGGLTKNIVDWGIWFKSEGYVALVVDSFSPRGTTNVCGYGRDPSVDEVALDAFGALVYLRSLPFVDRERIGVIGWSYGAMASLRAVTEEFFSQAHLEGGGFRVAVAFYPRCSYLSGGTVPTLLLLGERDDWTPPDLCVETGEQLQRAGRPVIVKVYPRALHAFDDGQYGMAARQYLGHTMQYDGAAAADAEKRVRAFLAQYLRGAH